MNKQIGDSIPGVSPHQSKDVQNQSSVGKAHFMRRSGLGRRSGLTSRQQAKNEECYAMDNAGFEALRAGQYSEAETYARQAIALTHGCDLLAPELLALALDAQDKTMEALDAYKMLADQGGDFPRIMLPYARLLLQTGQWAEAVATYNKQLSNLSFGDLVRANSHFSPAVQQPKELASAIHIAQGLTYISGEDLGSHTQEEAMSQFEQALQLMPASSLANYYFGYGLKRLGRRVEAQAAFRKAAALGQGDVKAAAQKELLGTALPR